MDACANAGVNLHGLVNNNVLTFKAAAEKYFSNVEYHICRCSVFIAIASMVGASMIMLMYASGWYCVTTNLSTSFQHLFVLFELSNKV